MNELMIWNTCIIFVITVWKHDLFKYMYFYSPKRIWHIWQCVTVKKKLKVESLTWKHLLSFRFYQSAKTFTGILLDIYKKTKLAP